MERDTSHLKLAATEMVATHELRIGDIVQTHGSRFRLASFNWDADQAADEIERMEEMKTDLPPGYTVEYIDAEIRRNRYLRNFSTNYLGPVPGQDEAIWLTVRHNWSIQGNDLARWAREIEEIPFG